MYIEDKIYGRFEVNEPVLIELINSKAMQRLKGIAQFGIPDDFYYRKGLSRFKHSIGVFLLLRKLGASLEEQIAGLLHDVSHTAFSHVADTLWGDPTVEDFQDNKLLEILLKSDVKQILEKYNFDIYTIVEHHQFTLLEQEIPNLCADRIDYTLQDLVSLGYHNLAYYLAGQLMSFDNHIVFNSLYPAQLFAEVFLDFNRRHWAGFESVSRYYQLAKILREAIEKNIIIKDDMWKEDKYIIEKLYHSNDNDIIKQLDRMKGGETKIRFGIKFPKKFRYIDPQILVNNKVVILSDVDNNYAQKLKLEKEKSILGMDI